MFNSDYYRRTRFKISTIIPIYFMSLKRNLLYNTLLNVGLILMIFSAVAAYNSQQYIYLAISAVIAVFLIYAKYLLIKQVRDLAKSRDKQKKTK